MLPRRHIRIKVFQTLYAFSQQLGDKKLDTKKALKNNLSDYVNLYYFIIDTLILIREIAENEIVAQKKKLLPTQEDLNPNKKFIQNNILKELNTRKKLSGKIDYKKLKIILKQIFKNLKNKNTYINYMESDEKSYQNDKKIVIHVLKNVITHESIHEFIEDYSIYWNDDLIIVYNIFLERINNEENLKYLNIFRSSDDEEFAKNLLEKTIEQEKKISSIIYDLAKNWDKERIALIDLILMKMAITEMMYIQTIPNKVTIDEYIEISKEYSTPKSKEFINGILDAFIKDILFKK